ncbi:MAG: TldD/PmbA family protein [Planctomycetota bacterium]|jgi:TldD protein
MIESETVSAVLEKALSRGADFADVYAEDRRGFSLTYVDRKAKNMTRGRDRGAGIRVLYGDRAVYAHTTDLDRDNLIKVAGTVAAAGKEGAKGALKPVGDPRRVRIIKVGEPAAGAKPEEFLDFARRADESARAADPIIAQVTAVVAWNEGERLIANSEGVHAGESRSYIMTRIETVAAEKGEQQTGMERNGTRTGLGEFRSFDPAVMGRDAAACAVRMLRAPHAPAGTMPVVIGNGFGGVIFHEACGHALETTTVAKDTSVFAGKLDKPVAADCVTAIDDGTMETYWGTTAIDDEGTPTKKTVLIDGGVLKSYLVDRLGAVKTGYQPTGSGRRESYRFAPAARMRNTYIAPGSAEFDAMISSVDQGLYAKKMGGGSVNPSTGEFNFAVLEGYMIRNGKIEGPVRGASLIGFGHEVLQKIEMVGKDLKLETGTCGSVSGWVPTTVGQATLKVSEITVGGRS